MHEKDIVLDVLSSSKAGLGAYAKFITECNNQNLRQTFQQMRDGDEKFQFDLYKIADQKGYYVPSPVASAQDATGIKSKLTQAATVQQGSGPVPSMS